MPLTLNEKSISTAPSSLSQGHVHTFMSHIYFHDIRLVNNSDRQMAKRIELTRCQKEKLDNYTVCERETG